MANPVLNELFFSSGAQTEGDDGLIWKEILPEGESAYTPTPRGPVKKPLRVVPSGKTDLSEGVIAMDEIVQNFDAGAIEHVPIVLGSKPAKRNPATGFGEGGDHEDITANHKGFVRKLEVREKDGGKKALFAGLDITEPDVREKCLRGTFANVSSGVFDRWLNKHTGQEFGGVLKHVSITNSPWIGGMTPFGRAVMASDDEIEEGTDMHPFLLDDLADEGEEVEVVWSERDSADWHRQKLQGQLGKLSEAVRQTGQSVYFWVQDIAPAKLKAIVQQESEGSSAQSFVVPYRVSEDDVELGSTALWTPTKTVMVAAADELTDDQLRQRVQNALGIQFGLGDDYVVEGVGKEDAAVRNELTGGRWHVGWELSAGKIWLDPTDEWRRDDGPVEDRPEPKPEAGTAGTERAELSDDTPRGRVAAAREARRARANNNHRGGAKKVAKPDFSALNLSDEQRAELERQWEETHLSDDERAELDTRRKKDREREVADKIDGLKEAGLADNPGALKYLRRIYLADDGQPSGVMLSDDERSETEVSLSDAFDGFLEIIKNQETGKLDLSAQLSAEEDHGRPAEDAEGENKSVDDQLKEAAELLGRPVPTRYRR